MNENDNTIDVLREKLNELVRNNAKYEDVYDASKKLDEYITKYYIENQK